MCLHTPRGFDNNSFVKRVATRDIVVWKVLTRATEKTALSPYQDSVYIFGKPRYSNIRIVDRPCGYATIENGLHAFISKRRANDRFYNWRNARTYPAIIPEGATFYLGGGNEVASTRLIVYKTMEDLEAVHGKVSRAVQVDKAAVKK